MIGVKKIIHCPACTAGSLSSSNAKAVVLIAQSFTSEPQLHAEQPFLLKINASGAHFSHFRAFWESFQVSLASV